MFEHGDYAKAVDRLRTARLLGLGRSYYHCVSRVVDRRFVLGDFEKEHFRKTMRKLEVFTWVEVLTYTVLSYVL